MEGEAWQREIEQQELHAEEGRKQLRQETLNTYRSMLKQMWIDGKPAKEERAMLDVVGRSLGITDADHIVLEREVQLESYAEALRSAWKSGIIDTDDTKTHENLRNLYGVTLDQHHAIEPGVLRDVRRSQSE